MNRRLLASRRFFPLFATQLLGALNDNLFKSGLIVALTVGAATRTGLGVDALVNLASAALILPFFLFSALAGQLADKLDKARLIQALKVTELLVMGLAVVGFKLESLPLLFGALFLMGTQSAFFGPLKYGILPQHLDADELMAGNGLVEMGTFLAILAGSLLGGLVVAVPALGPTLLGGLLLVVAVAGWLGARAIPAAPPSAPELALDFNLARGTWQTLQLARANRPAFKSILGASAFWFLGALILAQLPLIATDVLGGDERTITALLAIFSVGIGVGSVLSEKLGRGRIELGAVAPAALAIAALLADLAHSLAVAPADGAIGWRLGLDLFGLGLAGGLFIVPLYALMQERSEPSERSRIVGANNIVNAAFMVAAALFAVGLRALGGTLPQLMLAAAVFALATAAIATAWTRDFVVRAIVSVVVRLMYRTDVSGLDALPRHGPAIVAANHVSYMDAAILGGLCARPVRFVMDHRIHDAWPLRWFFRLCRAIPIASRGEDPARLDAAMEEIARALEDGEVVGIFPEGRLTRDGDMNPFRPGIERILARTPAPVIPVALDGLWGSVFSYAGGPPLKKLPRRFYSRVRVVAGAAMDPGGLDADRLEREVERLLSAP